MCSVLQPRKKAYIAILRERVKFLGKHKRSPYVQEYMSGDKTRPHIFETKYPFSEHICAAMDNDLIAEFKAWIDYGTDKKNKEAAYSKEDNLLSNPFDMGVIRVDKRE